MKKLLKASRLIVFALASFASSTLSAWYDPTGYWGRHYPNCYEFPSRGLYTVRAELMNLRPHIDNLKLDNTTIQNAVNFSGTPGLVLYTNDERKRRFQWRYGWKVGIGFACSDCWEADLNWTHYQSKAKLSDFAGVFTKWKVHVEMIDLEIGKEMWFRRCFRLKPYAGLRFAEIRQRYRFNIPGIIQPPFPAPGTPLFDLDIPSSFLVQGVMRHIYLAGGPRIGVDISWCLGCGFNFYIKAAANYLFGEMQDRYKDDLIVRGVDKDHHWEGTGITDLSCGIGWSDLWWNQTKRLTFRFGYEHHFFIHETKLDQEGAISRAQHNWFVQGVGGSIILDF